MKHIPLLIICLWLISCNNQSGRKTYLSKKEIYKGPIIDMHVHAIEDNELKPDSMAMCLPLSTIVKHFDPKDDFETIFWGKASDPECDYPIWSATTYEKFIQKLKIQLDKNKVTAVVSGSLPATQKLLEHLPNPLISGFQFRINRDSISVDSLRNTLINNNVMVFGEVSNQYTGIAPNDSRMFSYYKLLEELDMPLLLHMGSGLPGTFFILNSEFNAAHSNPLLLEEVLKKFPKMRIAVAHYGEPFIDEMITMMYHYPQIYIDLGGIQWCYPKAYFYEHHLKKLIDAGFDKRIMFGSDMIIWPELIEESIAIINEAEFLTYEQKADIFYNNAARFLRLEN